MKWICAALLACSLAAPVHASAAAQVWRLTSSEVSYRLVHKFHKVTGTSRTAEGMALIDGTGAKVMVRIPVKSFDSGNSNRDAHMLEVTDGVKYPNVVLKGRVPSGALQGKAKQAKVALDAELEFHGVRERRSIEVTLTRPDSRHLAVAFDFPVSLTTHKVKRPSLLFIKVDDAIRISGTIKMEAKP